MFSIGYVTYRSPAVHIKLKTYTYMYYKVRAMVLNTTFKKISVISWRSVEKTGVSGENH